MRGRELADNLAAALAIDACMCRRKNRCAWPRSHRGDRFERLRTLKQTGRNPPTAVHRGVTDALPNGVALGRGGPGRPLRRTVSNRCAVAFSHAGARRFLVQHRHQEGFHPGIILGHREMPDARHGNPHGAADLRRQFFAFLETGGRIVFAVHDVNRMASARYRSDERSPADRVRCCNNSDRRRKRPARPGYRTRRPRACISQAIAVR